MGGAKDQPAPESADRRPSDSPRAPWLRAVLSQIRHGMRSVATRWRRSLLFRTVASTVLLSALALLGAGAFLSNQIASGLFAERFRQVESESVRGLSEVKSIFESAATTDRASTHSLVMNTLKIVEGDGASVPRDFVLCRCPGTTTCMSAPLPAAD